MAEKRPHATMAARRQIPRRSKLLQQRRSPCPVQHGHCYPHLRHCLIRQADPSGANPSGAQRRWPIGGSQRGRSISSRRNPSIGHCPCAGAATPTPSASCWCCPPQGQWPIGRSRREPIARPRRRRKLTHRRALPPRPSPPPPVRLLPASNWRRQRRRTPRRRWRRRRKLKAVNPPRTWRTGRLASFPRRA